MLTVDVPGWKALALGYLVLDVNGTLSLDGALLDGVAERLADLRGSLEIQLLSADTFGRLDALAATLGLEAPGIHARRLEPGDEASQKAAVVAALGAEQVVAIGNGANDVAMLRAAGLGICVLGPEGSAAEAVAAADVVARDIGVALDVLRSPRRLVATLRR